MDMKNINNQSIFSIDWSADERRKMLRSIPTPKPIKHYCLAPGLSTKGVCGQDLSILDTRSVKAQLVGRGDFRAAWWNLYAAIFCWIFRSATLEETMYRFHKCHQQLTLHTLQLKTDYWTIVAAIRSGGTGGGIQCLIAISRERR